MTEGPITMTPAETATNSPGPSGADSVPDVPLTGAIAPPPMVRAPLSPAEAIGRLDRASKQGKLPGFERRGDTGFRALVYGEPFDRAVLGSVRPGGDGCVIELQLRLLRKMPAISIALVVVSIWPGVWLTDSMIQTYFPGYPNSFWVTAAWYLPLTVIPLPWVLRKMWRKSEGVAREELDKTVGKIVRAVGGTAG